MSLQPVADMLEEASDLLTNAMREVGSGHRDRLREAQGVIDDVLHDIDAKATGRRLDG